MIEDDAAALLAGPWRADPMEIRLSHVRDALLVPREVSALVAAVLLRFPEPPDQAELVDFLRSQTPLIGARLTSALAGPELALAALLDIDADELRWFADVQQRNRRARPPLQHYRWQVLPKRGGLRLVAAPKPRLKEIQRRLLRHALDQIPLHDAAHGCVPTRSVRTAVSPHSRAKVVVRLDLADFFPTITANRVRGLLLARGWDGPLAEAVTGLCTTTLPVRVWRAVPRPTEPARIEAHVRTGELLRTPHIPQGAPTSPALANAVAYGLDRRLAGLARRFGARYTRYVDDLTFSGGGFLLTHRHRFVDAATDIVTAEGFRVADRKTAVVTAAGRLTALGAVFNERPSLPRPERDRLRAIVHNCVVHGGASQARGRPHFRAELLGRIAAAGSLDPQLGARLRADYDRIDWDRDK